MRGEPEPYVGSIICYCVHAVSESFKNVHVGLIIKEGFDDFFDVKTYTILWASGNVSQVRYNENNVILRVIA